MGLAAANFAAGPGKKKRGDGLLMEVPSGSGRGDLISFAPQQQQPQESSPDLFSPSTSNESDWVNNPKE